MDSRSDRSEDESESAYDRYIRAIDNDEPSAYDDYMVAMGYVYDDEEGEYI